MVSAVDATDPDYLPVELSDPVIASPAVVARAAEVIAKHPWIEWVGCGCRNDGDNYARHVAEQLATAGLLTPDVTP